MDKKDYIQFYSKHSYSQLCIAESVYTKRIKTCNKRVQQIYFQRLSNCKTRAALKRNQKKKDDRELRLEVIKECINYLKTLNLIGL